MRVCPIHGCPTLVQADAYRGLCDQHRKERDQGRGSRAERGYGSEHQALRRRAIRDLTEGKTVRCWRCGHPILTVSDLHIGHDDDRSIVRGPEHSTCNLRAAGKRRGGRG